MKENTKVSAKDLVYELEGRPPLGVAIPLGLQHVLSMFVGNITPIIIVMGAMSKTKYAISPSDALLYIQLAMLASGIATFYQLYPIKIGGGYKIGGNLPIVMGTSFGFVPIASSVGAQHGLATVFGACLLGGLVTIAIGFLYKPLKKIFSELVVGSVLIAMGIKLLDPGVTYFAGGFGAKYGGDGSYGSYENLGLGFLVFALVVGLNRFGKGFAKMANILIAIVVGYVVAIPMGKVDFTKIIEADWIGLPVPPIAITDFVFEPSVLVSFGVLSVILGIETIGNTNGITIGAFNRKAKPEEVSGAVLADGLGTITAGLLSALPNTAFGQNAGLVAMTKIINKFCIAMGALILVLAAFIPKFSAIFQTIPDPVLGGAILPIFAMIIVNGLKLIGRAGFSERNMMILGIAFGLGYGFGSFPDATKLLPEWIRWMFKDTMVCVCTTAMIATLVFPESKEEMEKREKREEAIANAG